MNWQDAPCASLPLTAHRPMLPLSGGPIPVQPAMHVAAATMPSVHEVGPVTVYPSLHVGWHVAPDASELEQVPSKPLYGAADASHEFAEHVAGRSTPAAQVDGPETE